MDWRPKKTECSRNCGRTRRPGQRTCKECHAAEMRLVRFRTKKGAPAPVRRRGAEAAPAQKLRLCGTCLTKGRLVVASQTQTLMAVCTWCVIGQRPPADAELSGLEWEKMRKEAYRKVRSKTKGVPA